ncbi:type II toxin-antitoxin system RelE/ParE family toxin [Pedobacter endophyticus]|uniref:Type II toxin-antitoxin system RelE/ParE family toxin n=1 Tax=Pedobacter endophyticus TaxID=2789740 RepID=A0A7S9L1F8_9SPHI|nr:type II toxin-antitoxin system RelE/ParE family toxin [Pedobacter endophyticus]QPH40726.1 type II toxin-antitoxin system RelE/ParE family toxin [Pedobacter endophyticus]
MTGEIKIIYSPIFIKKAKQLKKKHPSLVNDLTQLAVALTANPKTGVDLGNGIFKIRLAVKSKDKGKSGGYRIITYLQTENEVTMIYIYDKSEEATISKKDIQKIIDSL